MTDTRFVRNRDMAHQLEDYIDARTVDELIELIANICHEKADHLRSNWQDDASAKIWLVAAHKLDKITLGV